MKATNPLIENNVLIVISGTSGSGKSTFADFLEFMIDGCEVTICTADDYFMINGEYKFDPTKLGRAHKWCQEKANCAMMHNVRLIIVANTSTSEKEKKPYLEMAEKHEYEVVEIIMNGGFKDIHGVPSDILKNQKQKLINSIK